MRACTRSHPHIASPAVRGCFHHTPHGTHHHLHPIMSTQQQHAMMMREATTTTTTTGNQEAAFLTRWFRVLIASVCILVLSMLNLMFWRSYIVTFAWALIASFVVRNHTLEFCQHVTQARMSLQAGHSSLSQVIRLIRNAEDGGPVMFLLRNPVPTMAVLMMVTLTSAWGIIMGTMVGSLMLAVTLTILDKLGISLFVTKRLESPRVMSMVVILSAVLFLGFITVALFVHSVFELSDVTYSFSLWVSDGISDLKETISTPPSNPHYDDSSSSSPIHTLAYYLVQSFNAAKQSLGGRKWWPIVESVRDSFIRGDPPPLVADNALHRLRDTYTDTDWLWIVETLVWATVPGSYPPQQHHQQQYQHQSFFPKLFHMPNVTNILWTMFSFLQDLLAAVIQFGGEVFIFFFLLQKLCGTKQNPLMLICHFILPSFLHDKRKEFAADLEIALIDVFQSPITCAHSHALVTFVCLYALQIPQPYIATLIVFITSSTRLIGPLQAYGIVSILWIASSLCRVLFHHRGSGGGQYWLWFGFCRTLIIPIALLRLHRVAVRAQRDKKTIATTTGAATKSLLLVRGHKRANEGEKQRSEIVSPWITDFSIGVAVSQFGVDGALIGPVLVALTVVSVRLATDMLGTGDHALAAATASSTDGGDVYGADDDDDGTLDETKSSPSFSPVDDSNGGFSHVTTTTTAGMHSMRRLTPRKASSMHAWDGGGGGGTTTSTAAPSWFALTPPKSDNVVEDVHHHSGHNGKKANVEVNGGVVPPHSASGAKVVI